MQGQVLSNEEKQIIHHDSIKILEEVGIKFPSEKGLDILETGGAKIDRDKQVAYISEQMVKAALRTTPKSFTLGARNTAFDFELPSTYSAYNLDGCGVNMLDFDTGKRRVAVLQDVENAAKIFEEIELGRVLWPPISPSDVPKGSRSIISTGTSFINTSKHVQDEVKDIREVYYVMEMAKAITGSMDEAIKRKLYSVTYCTVAPLAHDREMMEATMELTKYGAPVLIYPMPACGTTGPASLYSNIATGNAEALSAIVLFQLANPETPLIYGAALGSINMRSGIFLEGAPETVLQLTAMAEMGKYYNMPTIIAGCLTDAKEPGMQSVLEKILTTMPLVLAGVDIVQGIGLIESSMTMSLEHIVIDGEIGQLCKRIREGIHVTEAKNYYEDIKAVGQEGHFLKQKSTRAAFRSDEFTLPTLLDRGSYDEWFSLGSPNMFTKAHHKVEEILKAERKNPLDSSIEKMIREIMEEARAKLI
jgi:trimethylamine--corrinoid protein Co-methyltransferase